MPKWLDWVARFIVRPFSQLTQQLTPLLLSAGALCEHVTSISYRALASEWRRPCERLVYRSLTMGLICTFSFALAVLKLVDLGCVSCLSYWKRSKSICVLCLTWITILLCFALIQGSDWGILGGGVRRQLQYCEHHRSDAMDQGFLFLFSVTLVLYQLKGAAFHSSGMLCPKSRLKLAILSSFSHCRQLHMVLSWQKSL